MCVGMLYGFDQFVDDEFVGWKVGIVYVKVDDICVIGLCVCF